MIRVPAVGSREVLEQALGGRFALQGMLVKGATAEIYEAKEAERRVVVKVCHPKDQAARNALMRAADLSGRLTHPNNLGLLVALEVEGDVVLVSERAPGESLTRQLRSLGAFHEERALHLAIQMVRGLREAHALGLVHGSLHPDNLFVGTEGDDTDVVKIADYGSSALGAERPKYSSPELARGEPLDVRSDIYGLGLLLYEMITGLHPFPRKTGEALAEAQKSEPPPPLTKANPKIAISLLIEPIILRCLAKDPAARYPDAEALGADLRRRFSMTP